MPVSSQAKRVGVAGGDISLPNKISRADRLKGEGKVVCPDPLWLPVPVGVTGVDRVTPIMRRASAEAGLATDNRELTSCQRFFPSCRCFFIVESFALNSLYFFRSLHDDGKYGGNTPKLCRELMGRCSNALMLLQFTSNGSEHTGNADPSSTHTEMQARHRRQAQHQLQQPCSVLNLHVFYSGVRLLLTKNFGHVLALHLQHGNDAVFLLDRLL